MIDAIIWIKRSEFEAILNSNFNHAAVEYVHPVRGGESAKVRELCEKGVLHTGREISVIIEGRFRNEFGRETKFVKIFIQDKAVNSFDSVAQL